MIDTTRADEVLAWFARKGINEQSVVDFGISVGDDGAVLFPYGDVGTKRRYGIPTGERSFRWEKGVDPVLYNRRDLQFRNVFLCEGETDTIRLCQELGNDRQVGVVGLPGIETWNEGMAEDLRQAETVWVVLDNDQDYQVAGRVDTAWRSIRRELGRGARRIILPRGINDLCEFFEDYSLDALRLLVDRQPQVGDSRFRTLNLSVEPPPVQWLVERLFCKGDIHLMIGEPGLGKSWLTMALTIAIAAGRKEFLGYPITTAGRVLYFDEENAEDLVFHRFLKLGLDKTIAENIRFVSNAGIRLDHDPTGVLDESLAYEPDLIVLDSLTRFHGQDENSAGHMADLFNSGIKPLARETGAAVILIHHANKGEGSSYKRARGSGDITASADSAFDVTPIETDGAIDRGGIQIKNYKSRRSTAAPIIYVSAVNRPDGGVDIIGHSAAKGQF